MDRENLRPESWAHERKEEGKQATHQLKTEQNDESKAEPGVKSVHVRDVLVVVEFEYRPQTDSSDDKRCC